MFEVYIISAAILLLGAVFGLFYVFGRRVEKYDDWKIHDNTKENDYESRNNL